MNCDIGHSYRRIPSSWVVTPRILTVDTNVSGRYRVSVSRMSLHRTYWPIQGSTNDYHLVVLSGNHPPNNLATLCSHSRLLSRWMLQVRLKRW
jgi:hypothetical protein